jgi:acetylornithine deacetylase/succinyl-diaminopimelate desuccinylase-like protein
MDGSVVPAALLVLAVLALPSLAGAQAAETPDLVASGPAVARALDALDRNHDRLVQDIITLTEIPAPPFKEDRRAAAFLARLEAAGLSNVERDAEGNVMGIRRGTGGGPLIAIAAHLDTVFGEETDVAVKRDGSRLLAPGIGDNSRSLAALLAIIRALDEAGVRTRSDLLFVGNVGEEGPGDLRGVRHLFTKGAYRDRIGMFISMDGVGDGDHIITRAVASRRYRVTFKGPGGHSYGAFGLVNPAFALGTAVDALSRIAVPETPKTTFNVGVMGGGTSVNSIPSDVWIDVDLRSEDAARLAALEADFKAAMQAGADAENARRSTRLGGIELDFALTGDRPTGATSERAALVQTAAAVVRHVGGTPTFGASSTDANLPMSLGIPAITIDSGGRGGRAHALDEWIDVDKAVSLRGLRIALLLIASLGGAQ